jgi:hypothetical protein
MDEARPGQARTMGFDARNKKKRDVDATVSNPPQLIDGYGDTKIAQDKWGDGVLRIVFVEGPGFRKIVTLYWTSKVVKYWREDEDGD